MESNHYPEEVKSWALTLTGFLSEEGFFEEYGVSPVHGIPVMERRLCEAILPNWLNDGDMTISEKDLEDVMRASVTEALLSGMKEKGLIDSIEDEAGEEVYFLTHQGKEVAEAIKEEHGV
jgi:hypothetical protein